MTQVIRPPSEWDKHTIKAEIHRRGMTMTGIARAAGLPEDACRKALFGLSRAGADAIAEALGIPFDTLFPTGFVQSRSGRLQASANDAKLSRHAPPSSPTRERVRA